MRICFQLTKEEVQQEEGQALLTNPKAEMETDTSLPLCMGPGCPKQPLPDSVYCGTDCIIQHAAVAMKTLSDPKEPKSKGRVQRKSTTARPIAKVSRNMQTELIKVCELCVQALGSGFEKMIVLLFQNVHLRLKGQFVCLRGWQENLLKMLKRRR